jgi:alpha-mannosidase
MPSKLSLVLLTGLSVCLVAGTAPASQPDLTKEPTLYVMNYSHLDTQWRWDYPWTIREDLRKTLYDNFAIMAKDPTYVFNWTGASRYQMFQEYYPEEYRTLKAFAAKGQWFGAGSAWEESDVNVPSSESLVRQILMGHHFFKTEFGTESSEYALPDCFGFPASLPSILAHCGLKGFSTQKLGWGCAVGIPFNIGRWVGPDGHSIVAALNPGVYSAHLEGPLNGQTWLQRLQENGQAGGLMVDLLYNGNGDEGGAPHPDSMRVLKEALQSQGPVKVIAGRSDLMFNAISEAQKAKLPSYKGDLELTEHSAGSLSSQAFMKRVNRTDELLADAAEKAAAAADLLGAGAYPAETFHKAWGLTLRSQFHDTLPGTCIPKAYEYAWNDDLIAAKAFDGALNDAVGAVARGLDTRVDGTPLVVFNALGIAREDVVEALVPEGLRNAASITAVDGAGQPLPTQLAQGPDGKMRVLFLAKVPSVGFAVYGLKAGEAPRASDLSITERSLENARYRVSLDAAGDVASIYDKVHKRELLKAPMRLLFQHENPEVYPAWNMDWADRQKPPLGYVDGPVYIRRAEFGPVRAALEVEREARGSRFVQQIRLASGPGGDRVEITNLIDWKSSESSLRATFPLTVSNPKATYNWDLGTLERGNNEPVKYEVATHGWIDLADAKGEYGVTLLTGAKYGSDKPSDDTLRLTLLFTPGVRDSFCHEQRFQDWGRHAITFGLAGHAGDGRKAGATWLAQRQDSPLRAFAVEPHDGPLGKSLSLFRTGSSQVAIQAVKRAEDGQDIVVRLQELQGRPAADITLQGLGPILEAKDLDGVERPLGPLSPSHGALKLDFTPYQMRTVGLRLQPPARIQTPEAEALPLPYDLDAFSWPANLQDGSMDGRTTSYPAEMISDTVPAAGVAFRMGSRKDGDANALICAGQTLAIPAGTHRVHLLMAAAGRDVKAEFKVGDRAVTLGVPSWTGYVGSWDNRIFKERNGEGAFTCISDLESIAPAYLKEARPAWWASHRHENGRDTIYSYGYLFAFTLDVPAGATTLTLPASPTLRLFAASAATRDNVAVSLNALFPDFVRDEDFKARFEKP